MTIPAADKTQTLQSDQQEYLFPAVSKLLYGDPPVAMSHGKDQYLWDVDGRRYLDFFGGILTVGVGHCNDEVTAATMEQLNRLQHTSTVYINEIAIEVARKVAAITPGRLQKCFFTNSGSEADETAVMAARMFTGNTDVIALRHAYSGRTVTAMSLTAHSSWRLGGVFDGGVKHVRSPYTYRAPVGLDEDKLLDLCVEDLEEMIATCTNGRIAAFMAEPIQGVGGFVVAPKDYFRRILPIVEAAGGLLIIDEVQTGWGRTGTHMCGIEHWGVEPDIMTFAKGMANGFPVGCTIATPEVADAVDGLTLSTFGGNPVAMATALATIEYIEKHDLPRNAEVRGARLRERLLTMAESFPFIGEVRGMGLMQALELVVPDGRKTPDNDRAGALVSACHRQGLLVGKGGLYGNVMRIAPHLTVAAADLETGCDLLESALSDVA